MARKPYRVELEYPTRGKPRHFLVRDVKVGNKRRKVRKYLGTSQPSHEDLEKYRREYAAEMELRAAMKKAEMSSNLFRARYMSAQQLAELEKVKAVYNGVIDLMTTDEVAAYEKSFEMSYIQGTTSIEGNTLTLVETTRLLEYGIAPAGKTLREINEVQNFRNVAKFRSSYKGKVSIDFIRRLHSLVMANIDNEYAGQFRRIDDIMIAGCDLKPTPAIAIENELDELIAQHYRDGLTDYHPFELAAMFHYHFEIIHPFTDGNGRVGREVMNHMLTRSKFPRFLFLGKDREAYVGALRKGNEGHYAEMIQSFAEIMVKQRLSVLTERLEELATPRKKRGQLSLWEFA